MEQALDSSEDAPTWAKACDNCGRDLAKRLSFTFKPKQIPGAADQPAELTKCVSCAVRHRPMVKRSLTAAVVVGTVLTLLNQGDLLLTGQWNGAMYWKIPLTYCVPFLVATYGALTTSRN